MIKLNEINTSNYVSKSKLPASDYVINPYVGCTHKCIYCYAEFMKRFTGHTEEWGDFIDVKRCNKPVFIKPNNTVFISSVTDAYNPFERKFRVTEMILKQLVTSHANIEILTKSSLVTRDIELFKQIPNIRVGISVNSLDDTFRKQTEPFASSVSERINALKILHEEGIKTYLFMSPIFPEITNFEEILYRTKDFVDSFYFENLNLRAGYLNRVLSYIENQHPHLIDLYNDIYKNKNILYWEKLSDSINSFCKLNNLTYGMYFHHGEMKTR